MGSQQKTPIYEIDMFVDEHNAKEPSDDNEPDIYRAYDDVVKANLSTGQAFTAQIFAKTKSAPIEHPLTEQ